jgi:hypothetical protein
VLNASDLYDVEYWKVRGIKSALIASDSDVHAEDLIRLFETRTGFATRL